MATSIFIGNTIERRGKRLVKTDGKDTIYFLLQDDGVPLGMKVKIEVKNYDLERRESDPYAEISCKVIEVLGNASDPDLAMKSLIVAYDLDKKFSEDAIEEATNFANLYTENLINEEIARGRRDLRELKTFTIDGVDAKDLDDAISIEVLDNGKRRLWVHIADVSHFVTEDTKLDTEALLRGNSTYLPGQVFPMLPTQLSNGICSLNPSEDRLCLSVAIVYDKNCKVITSKIFETVINSDLRADYKSIREYFEDFSDAELLPYQVEKLKKKLPEKYLNLVDELLACRKLYFELREKRMRQGSLDFSFTESKVIFDEDGKVADITARTQTWSEGLIEEFMIAANEAVATHARMKKIPILYRTHDEPEQELLIHFAPLARAQGVDITIPEHPSPKVIADWIEGIKELDVSEMLLTLLLRSLAKARYDAEPLGHFGLALKDYCHFTSPIRRYSDLFTHRAIKNHLAGLSNKNLKRNAQNIADHISQTEVISQYAERDAIKICMAEYMLDKIGEEYVGQITGFCSRGAFIRLANTVEGLAPFEQLGDFFEYDEKALVARGRNSRRVLKIGDEVCVRVAGTSVASASVDFDFVKGQLPGEKYFQKQKAFDYLFKDNNDGHLRRRFRKSGFEDELADEGIVVETLRRLSEEEKKTNQDVEENDFFKNIVDDVDTEIKVNPLKRKRRPYNRKPDDSIFAYGEEREFKYSEVYSRQGNFAPKSKVDRESKFNRDSKFAQEERFDRESKFAGRSKFEQKFKFDKQSKFDNKRSFEKSSKGKKFSKANSLTSGFEKKDKFKQNRNRKKGVYSDASRNYSADFAEFNNVDLSDEINREVKKLKSRSKRKFNSKSGSNSSKGRQSRSRDKFSSSSKFGFGDAKSAKLKNKFTRKNSRISNKKKK